MKHYLDRKCKRIAHILGTEVDQEKERWTREKVGASLARRRVTRAETALRKDTEEEEIEEVEEIEKIEEEIEETVAHTEDQDHLATIAETADAPEEIDQWILETDAEATPETANTSQEDLHHTAT